MTVIKNHSVEVDSLEQLEKVAATLLKHAGDRKVLAFYGEMGAGKTTFIKKICQQLGVIDVVNSPTFAIINEYKNKEGQSLFHFDFYRLHKTQEALDVGIEDYFTGQYYCFIEWPEIVEDFFPDNTLNVFIEVCPDNKRRISF